MAKFLDVGHVAGVDQVPDIFTKPLTANQFHMLCQKLSLQEMVGSSPSVGGVLV